jgi:cobalt-zinc-cadmium efflux system protein
MAHGHHHGHTHHDHSPDRGRSRRGLSVALGLTLGVLAAEIAGGIAAHSLALLADAGHLLTDAAALSLALVAGIMAERPAAGRRTFGWQRAEILAALANGVLLVLIAAATLVEAAIRIGDPPHVKGALTLAVAGVALVVNLGSGAVLMRSGSGLNVRAALRHVLADAVSSLGVIVAALCIIAFGWRVADPLVSIGIAFLILFSAVSILRESTDVLLEAAPAETDVPAMGRAMARVDGVIEVHDLHVWTVTSGFPAVAAHVTVAATAEPSLVRRRMAEMLRRHFGVTHSTLQVEREGSEQALLQIRREG